MNFAVGGLQGGAGSRLAKAETGQTRCILSGDGLTIYFQDAVIRRQA